MDQNLAVVCSNEDEWMAVIDWIIAKGWRSLSGKSDIFKLSLPHCLYPYDSGTQSDLEYALKKEYITIPATEFLQGKKHFHIFN